MKHPPERPLVITKDTREPAIEAGDHPDSVFTPRIFAPGTRRDTRWQDRPRVAVPVQRCKLDVGDYSLPGLESRVALERKSGPDLLATLFGDAGTDALGEARHNLDRFRAELERARGLALFAIVCEASEGWLFTEARRRWDAYGKSFDPFAVLGMLRSFAIDLGVPTLWCGSKGLAELEVGSTLARVWSQATGGEKARDARKRGYGSAWLDVLVDRGCDVEDQPRGVREIDCGGHRVVTDVPEDAGERPRDRGAEGVGGPDVSATGLRAPDGTAGPLVVAGAYMPRPPAPRLIPGGGLAVPATEALDRRARKRKAG